jgi:hypothetical protein
LSRQHIQSHRCLFRQNHANRQRQIELETAEAKVAAFSSSAAAISATTVQALDRQLKDLRDRLAAAQIAHDTAAGNLVTVTALEPASAQEKSDQLGDAQLTALLPTAVEDQAFEARFAQLASRAKTQAERSALQLSSLTQSVRTREAKISTQNNEIIQLQQLSREADASRLLYEYFLGRLKETAAQEGIQQADSRILSNAVLPLGPSAPRKSRILALSLVLGALIGSAAALLWEARQDGYRTGNELEEDTGLPVMGQIPLLPAKTRKGGLQYLASKPASASTEAIRNLRTSMLLADPDKAPKVIISTSALPSEGKTTISFALAQNLVGLGKSVLLVEGDIRRRVFSQYLDAIDAKGLMSVLAQETTLKDAVIRDDILGADVLLSEECTQNAADVLSSQSFQSFLDTARSAYDFVIIDTPPFSWCLIVV